MVPLFKYVIFIFLIILIDIKYTIGNNFNDSLVKFDSLSYNKPHLQESRQTAEQKRKLLLLQQSTEKNPSTKREIASGKIINLRAGFSDGTQERCRCVLFYQCNRDDVIDIGNILNQTNENCSAVSEVCCRLQNDLGGEIDAPIPALTIPQTSTEIFVIASPSTTSDTNTSCECVHPSECTNDRIINPSGIGLIDIRFKECQPDEVCCIPLTDITPVDQTDLPPIIDIPSPSASPSIDPSSEPSIPSSPDTSEKCGYSKVDIATRIVGPTGVTDAAFGEFPWMAVILKTDISDNGERIENVFQCGASLINPSIVLTAAHCLNKMDKSILKVRVGEFDTTVGAKNEPRPHQDSRVSSVTIHPQFHSGALFNDIAIILTETPFDLTDNVNTVCLPKTNNEQYDPTNCISMGWGLNSFDIEGKFQTKLKKVYLPLINNVECQKMLRKTRLGNYFKLDPSFMCAGGKRGEDTCKGDGGGPLICSMKNEPNKYVQVGIVSWGIGCGDENIPGVYASVESNLKWLSEEMNTITWGGIFRSKISTKN